MAERATGRAVLALTATSVHFLLFAQFGFLDHLEAALDGPRAVQVAMAWMGVAGLLASLGTGAVAGRIGAARLLRPALVACAAVAALSPLVVGTWPLRLLSAGVGAATGVLAVALAAALRDLVPAGRVGSTAGLATGLGYLVSNLPPLFTASPTVRALVPAGLSLVAALAVPRPLGAESENRRDLAAGWFRVPGLAAAVVAFLLLVGLDAAAFAHVQATPALRALTWEGPGRQLLQGAVHLLAALGAGALLGRGRLGAALVATGALFAAAFHLLAGGGAAAVLAGPLYAVGISLYSTALLAYPSLGPEGTGTVPRRWRAALLYGVAGWLGSALGVGMAQDLGRLPSAAAAGVAAGLALAAVLGRRRARRLVGPAAAAGIVVLLSSLPTLDGAAGTPAGPLAAALAARDTRLDPESAARGRRVYVAEGCIHCHSQLVRPGVPREAEWWGPTRPVDRREAPPLVGVRRLGPDLANVGNRRSAAWHALHLADPRAVVPGSRMPSYRHLFAGDGRRGSDLVAYLATLGAGGERPAAAPPRPPRPASIARGRHLFAAWCAPCHGAAGRGDGPLAAALHRPAMDLAKGPPWSVSWGAGQPPLEEGLARVVRQGIPGTSMPGHEWLSDQQVADLAAFVASLARRSAEGA